jgi:hypothetical protein
VCVIVLSVVCIHSSHQYLVPIALIILLYCRLYKIDGEVANKSSISEVAYFVSLSPIRPFGCYLRHQLHEYMVHAMIG